MVGGDRARKTGACRRAGCARARRGFAFYWAGGVEPALIRERITFGEIRRERSETIPGTVAPVWPRLRQCGQGQVDGAQDHSGKVRPLGPRTTGNRSTSPAGAGSVMALSRAGSDR